MSRLDELYDMRSRLDVAIQREQAQMLRMARLRDVFNELMDKQSVATTETLRAVAAEYDLDVSFIVSGSRVPEVVAARMVGCALLRDLAMSYPEIGRVLGVHHTTVMHACRRVASDPALGAAANHVRDSLAGRSAVAS